MKQLIQDFKTGELKLIEVPCPAVGDGFVGVKNRFSLISAGTEKATISAGRASLIGKAQKRPDLVRQTLQNIRKEGIRATVQKVQAKLDTPKALGYSTCGIVVESRDFDQCFSSGDRVACAGQDYASHADMVSVPQNLVVKIPDAVSFKEAAFTTLGAIALQGVRQADPKIGEYVCVIGLGLLGQITAQILSAGGCRVCGIDIDDFCLRIARECGIDSAINRNDPELYRCLDGFTKKHGFDKVIITASAADNDPLILATEIVRKKGTVVVVGDIKMDVPREPHFYRKELELKIATSYGPGRYDPLYEECGFDYPYPYVRFTEKRNMEAFLGLVERKKIDLNPLISHVFDFADALKAYDVISGSQPSMGVLLKYDASSGEISRVTVTSSRTGTKKINVGFIGAGSFAQSYLLPNLKGNDVSLDTVVTRRGVSARSVAEKFSFRCAATDPEAVYGNEDINTVFIATHHNTHASFARRALARGQHVFVEKPLAMNTEELKGVVSSYTPETMLMVGFNRRFSSLSQTIKKELMKSQNPLLMHFRVNAGSLPPEHWVKNPEVGGGRIISEICHFVDLMVYFSGSLPRKVYASALKASQEGMGADENVTVNIELENGSAGNIFYTAMGDMSMEKERLEIFSGGNCYLIDNFTRAVLYRRGKRKIIRKTDKGHGEEVKAVLSALRKGGQAPIDFKEIAAVTLTTCKIAESLSEQRPQIIDLREIYS